MSITLIIQWIFEVSVVMSVADTTYLEKRQSCIYVINIDFFHEEVLIL